jgi:polyphosphate:AMP phosphotransferase
MFETAELGSSVDKEEYEAAVPQLRVDLINTQTDLRSADFSVVVLVVGDDRKGCNEVLDLIHEWMDTRGIETQAFLGRSDEELERPPFWRYWRALPRHGRIAVLYGAWPLIGIANRVKGRIDDAEYERRIARARSFERNLVRNGTLLLKFWIHLPKKKLKQRLEKADTDPYVDQRDWEIYEGYDDAIPVAANFLRQTDTAEAPWLLVEGTNRRHRNLTVMRTVLESIRARLESPPREPERPVPAVSTTPGILQTVDLSSVLPYDEYRRQLEAKQEELSNLAREAMERGVSTVLAFEGWDAAGKGGVIRRITNAMPAQYYQVVPVAAPTQEEHERHYLWRFWRRLPRAGYMRIFDRTWYGRVLVERVEGFATTAEWQRAYEEINALEDQLVSHGIAFAKFWLHIDPDEQLRRFQAREKTPYKKYKITEEDYRNREKRGAYEAAVEDMVRHTSTDVSPWHLVPANDKRFARLYVLRTVCEQLGEALRRRG